MAYSDERLNDIFDKTDGHCHICHEKLSFGSYGNVAARRGWEVEHSVPRANGGTDHLNNLFPAHVSCNRRKRHGSTRSARALHGFTRAPYSKAKKDIIQDKNTLGGCTLGGFVGGAVGGPIGFVIGTTIGGIAGRSLKVPR